MPDELYFHEDDYCQQELLPLAAMEFCKQQISEIDEFSAAHQVPGGMGWTDLFVRKDSADKLVDLEITLDELHESLSEHLPPVPAIYTGYSSYRVKCEQTIGFGVDTECVVYASWNERRVIEAIWTSLFTSDAKDLKSAVAALQQLGLRYPLLYVDWAWNFATPLDQSPSLQDRVISKNNEIARRMKNT